MSQDEADEVSIAILARAPFPGTVKTRLLFMLGVDGAAELEGRLIRQTVERAIEADVGPITLWVTPGESHPLFEDLTIDGALAIEEQPGTDMDACIHAAILGTESPVLFLRTDSPLLTADHLREAADVLRNAADAVIIPTEEGGCILLGLTDPHPRLFAGLTWTSDNLLAETRQRLTQLAVSWRELEPLWEVDRPTDVRRMRREGLEALLAGLGHSPTSMFEQLAANAPPAA